MEIKAKDTTAALRRHVFPLLRANGFDDGTSRRLWRHRNGRIDHIEFASLSTYDAAVNNCPTASLAVRLGLSLKNYGATEDPFQKNYLKVGPKGPRPRESQMPIRGVLSPGDAPAMTRGRWGWEFEWIWRIATVDDAEAAAVDLRRQLEEYCLDWLTQEWDLKEILSLLATDEPSPILISTANGSHLKLDAGMPGSQVRNAHIVMAKRALFGRTLPG